MNNWHKVKIKDLIDYERPDEFIVKNVNYSDHGCPVLTANKSFILGYTNEIDGIYSKIPAIIFDDFTTDCKYVDFPFKVKSSAIKILREKNSSIDLRFVFELMKSIHFSVGNHKRYYISEYQNLDVDVPPYLIQKKISDILLTLDEVTQKTDQIIQKTEVLKKGLMQELLTKGIGHKRLKKTKLGEIPEEWDIKQLNEVTFNITDGKHGDCNNESNSGYYFVSVKDIYNGQINYQGARQITKSDFEETHKRTKLEPGDLLLTNSGTIGRMAVIQDNLYTKTTTFQKSVAVIKPDTSRVNVYYLIHALTLVLKSLITESSGSAQKNLLLKDLRNYKIPFPSLKEQAQISEVFGEIDSKLIDERLNIKHLILLKKGLMQDIFSQKVQIN